MEKKKINKHVIQKILQSLPKEVKQKMLQANKSGKKITLKIQGKKRDNTVSPYQDK